jgi:hypothetical protein
MLLVFILVIIGTVFSLKITGLFDKDIIIGLIGFLGTMLGGLITFFGVLLTMRHNEKMKETENLQRKYRI